MLKSSYAVPQNVPALDKYPFNTKEDNNGGVEERKRH